MELVQILTQLSKVKTRIKDSKSIGKCFLRAHLTAKSRRGCVGVNLKKLGTSNWWLSSPNNYNGSNANEWNVNGSNGNINTNNVNNTNAFRPRFLLCRILNNICYTEY